MSIQLEPRHLAEVKRLLATHAPEARVWCFGSRAKGKAKRFSDLDLVLEMDGGVPTKTLLGLYAAFSDGDLPIKVDVLDWAGLDPEFREIIASHRVPL